MYCNDFKQKKLEMAKISPVKYFFRKIPWWLRSDQSWDLMYSLGTISPIAVDASSNWPSGTVYSVCQSHLSSCCLLLCLFICLLSTTACCCPPGVCDSNFLSVSTVTTSRWDCMVYLLSCVCAFLKIEYLFVNMIHIFAFCSPPSP